MEFTIEETIYKYNDREVCRAIWHEQRICAKIGTDIQRLEEEHKHLLKYSGFKNTLKVFGFNKYVDNITKTVKAAILIEYCEKGDLAQFIEQRRKKNMPMLETKVWMHLKDLNSLLRYLQRRGMSHRDIKPDNIFVGGEEELKLADFGEGKKISKSIDHTLRGTPSYLTPILDVLL